MIIKNMKGRFHIVEGWAILGILFIFYFLFFSGHYPDLVAGNIYLFLLGALLVGFGHSLIMNHFLYKPVTLVLALNSNGNEPGVEDFSELRKKIFMLPIMRSLWQFERFLVTGVLSLVVLALKTSASPVQLVLAGLFIIVSGFMSSLLLFYSMEQYTQTIHHSLHQKVEHNNHEVKRGPTISFQVRLYAAFGTVLTMIFLFLGSLPLVGSSGATFSSASYVVHVIVLFILFALITFLLVYFMGRSLNSSVQSLLLSMSRSEHGDLGTRTPVISSDQIGNLADSFNKMMRELSEIFGKVRQVSDSVTLVADRLSGSSVAMSEGVELQATSTDTTASSMAQMQFSITEVAASVNVLFDETEKTSTSIIEMTSSVEKVAVNIESLSHSIDTTSTSIEEMNASIKQVADNSVVLNRSAAELFRATDQINRTVGEVEQWAIESSKLSNKVTQDADMGHKAVLKTIEGMEKIHKFFQTSGEVIQNLSERSEQIGNILNVIDDVSSQTNLLALNAAIISAQAGEHGKEFSVVADEIRDLAEKAAGATKEIAHLITNVQGEAAKAVQTMEEGARLVAQGVKLTHRAGDVLKMIIASSTESAKMTNLIEEATINQVGRSQEIAKIVENLKAMSDQIAVATKEQKIGISQIMRESENMRDTALQVHSATDKQTFESRAISKAVSEVKEMVERIRTATTQQKSESMSVLEAVEIFKDITLKNVDSMVEMDKAVDTLASQVKSLENQVSRFRV